MKRRNTNNIYSLSPFDYDYAYGEKKLFNQQWLVVSQFRKSRGHHNPKGRVIDDSLRHERLNRRCQEWLGIDPERSNDSFCDLCLGVPHC